MKNYKIYPEFINNIRDKNFLYDFWKDAPVMSKEENDNFKHQWCIINFNRWFLSENNKEFYYK